MSPDVLFSIGFFLILFAVGGGGFLIGRADRRDEDREVFYWEGYRHAQAQAEEFIVFPDDHEAVL